MSYRFIFAPMPKLLTGPGTVSRIGALAASFGHRVLLVTGANALKRGGHLSRIGNVLNDAGLQVQHCTISGEPSPEIVDAAVCGLLIPRLHVVRPAFMVWAPTARA